MALGGPLQGPRPGLSLHKFRRGAGLVGRKKRLPGAQGRGSRAEGVVHAGGRPSAGAARDRHGRRSCRG